MNRSRILATTVAAVSAAVLLAGSGAVQASAEYHDMRKPAKTTNLAEYHDMRIPR